MAKLILVAAVLVALFAIAQVSSYRTIVTTTVVEEGNPSQSQQERCRQHIEQKTRQQFEQQFRPCQTHLSQQSHSYDIVMMTNRNPQQQLQQCCAQLKQIDEECVCQAVQMVVDQQQKQQHQEQGQRREQQMKQIQQKAEQLPDQCNIITTRRCQIQIQSS